MTILLLVIIYVSFISLGLPDAIMGSAWPMIYPDLSVPVSYAGFFTMIVSGGTIISSFFSEKLIRRFKTGTVTLFSVFLTAAALLGVSAAPGFLWMCILAVPMGLGAGAVDAALNNFVALHFKARHMNWLHSFWGIGATSGPLIMSVFLARENGWRLGYGTIGIIQAALAACLIITLPVWKSVEGRRETGVTLEESVKVSVLLRLKGAKPAFLSFFCYCAVEMTAGLWGSSYLVLIKGVSAEKAAKWISFYYLGITAGRFFSGLLSSIFHNRMMLRFGQITCFLGSAVLLLPFSGYFQLAGFILIGFGCAPIYPAMLHETPSRFGKKLSQAIMGIQMAAAYVGSTLIPPLFGLLGKNFGFQLLPLFLSAVIVVMFITSEMAGRKGGRNAV